MHPLLSWSDPLQATLFSFLCPSSVAEIGGSMSWKLSPCTEIGVRAISVHQRTSILFPPTRNLPSSVVSRWQRACMRFQGHTIWEGRGFHFNIKVLGDGPCITEEAPLMLSLRIQKIQALKTNMHLLGVLWRQSKPPRLQATEQSLSFWIPRHSKTRLRILGPISSVCAV
jgi:hypothetical protein